MSFVNLVNNSLTDKNTSHSYLPLYQTLLGKKQNTAENVLEIGVERGGSIQLWSDFFVNAHIYGIDLKSDTELRQCGCPVDELVKRPVVSLYTSTNAYDEATVQHLFLDTGVAFDVVIDDGPHTLDSMVRCIQLYAPLLTYDGVLIIEDVQSWSWMTTLTDAVPEHLQQYVQTYDLRDHKNRYDDMVFVIDKTALTVRL